VSRARKQQEADRSLYRPISEPSFHRPVCSPCFLILSGFFFDLLSDPEDERGVPPNASELELHGVITERNVLY
jgi:hypothetical protein